jgi:hypothetical protein
MSQQDRGYDQGDDGGESGIRKSPTQMGPPAPEPPPVSAMPPVLYITPRMPSPDTVPRVEAEMVRVEEGSPPPLEELLSQGIEISEPEEE